MRALLVAVGTRGDVQPALALALELRKLGHDVRLCISPNFVEWATSLGLEALPLGVEMRMPASRSGTTPQLTPEQLRQLRESMPDLVTDQFKTIGAAVEDCDVILGANTHQYGAPSIAEHAAIPYVTAVYCPVSIPSPELAPPPPPGQRDDPDTTSTISQRWLATANLWNERALARVNANRNQLGLPPIADVLDHVLTNHTWLAADAPLAPVPLTPGRTIFQTGAWLFPDDTPLPEPLEAFLQTGAPPVFLGFGSMPASDHVARAFIGAARANNRRIILSRGWAELALADNAPDCIIVDDVCHPLLFPRVAAVIHHGGAGTTAAAARAGVPQLISPMFSDQFYWARRVTELGIGSSASINGFSQESLDATLRDILTPSVADSARALATRLRSDGANIAANRLVAECRS